MGKERLDVLLHRRGLVESRELARRLIMAGEVKVDGQMVDKPGKRVAVDAVVELQEPPRYVSRGGQKLEAALHAFSVDVVSLVAADIGASTGGFTDCLLQHGAAKVYAIDVGYGQLAWSLRQDHRVTVLERVNARHLSALPEPVHLATVDVSFISLKLVLPAIVALLVDQGQIISLIKPQFEAGRNQVGRGGVVRDRAVHRQVLIEILRWATEQGLTVCGLIPSPLRGPAGNVEFLALLLKGGSDAEVNLGLLIDQCLAAVEP
jgi:23S rRNA (cytidine1920-2'-O)/16S rRNA (cytidine1409-2'-O)-methyltransferase